MKKLKCTYKKHLKLITLYSHAGTFKYTEA